MGTIRGTVTIEIETCKGCEICVGACQQKCLAMSKDINKKGYHYAVLIQDNCTGCANCALVCPDSAIAVYRVKKKAKEKELIASLSNVKQQPRITLDEIPEGGVSI